MHSRLASKCWFTAEYLMWFCQSQPTTSRSSPPAPRGRRPASGEPRARRSCTPDSDLGYDLVSGFRITGGLFKDDCRRYGLVRQRVHDEEAEDGRFFATSDAHRPAAAGPAVHQRRHRPAERAVRLLPDLRVRPGHGVQHSRAWGAEGGPICNLFRSCPDDCDQWRAIWNVDLLTGFRFFQLKEELQIQSFTDVLPGTGLPFDGKLYCGPVNIEVNDEFQTTNQFYGGQDRDQRRSAASASARSG